MLKIEVSGRGLLFIVAILVSVWLLTRLWPVLILILIALIFTAALLPYVEWLVKHGFHRAVAVLLLLFGILLVIAGMGALVVPAMISEFSSLRDNLPEDAREFERFAENFGFDTENWDLPERAEQINWTELISGRAAVNYGQRVAFGLFSALTVIVLTAYFLMDAPKITRNIYRFVPSGREEDVGRILESLGRVVGGYVRGQAVTSLVIAVFTLAVLLVLGVENAIAFAVLAGFADIIPLVGAFIATIPPVVAAFQDSPSTAVIVLVALVLYQQFEDRYLVPRIYGATLNLSPLVVFVAILAGGEVLGITGVLLALPVVAAGRVLLDFYFEQRTGRPFLPADDGEEVAAPDIEEETPPVG